MKNFKSVIIVLVVALLSGLGATVNAAEHKGGLFVNLTTDDSWAAKKAIMFSHKKVLKRGHKPVAIWLNVRGIHLADKRRAEDAKIQSMQNMLGAFIKDGGIVIACQACSKKIGLTKADLVDGIKMGNPKMIIGLLFDPAVKTLSW